MSTFRLDPIAVDRLRREMLGPAAEAGARIVVNHIKMGMENAPPRTGRTYLVPGTQTPYVASAPGEPPAVRTAAYRDSWEPTNAVVEGDTARAAAVSGMLDDDGELLGDSLEHGRPERSLLPRPHIRPVLEPARAEWLNLLRRWGARAT